jgi:hypothetical protein
MAVSDAQPNHHKSNQQNCVPVNRQYTRPGKVTCDCVSASDPCFIVPRTNLHRKGRVTSGPHCILDKSCMTEN